MGVELLVASSASHSEQADGAGDSGHAPPRRPFHPSARSAIQRRPGCALKRSPAPPSSATTAGVWSGTGTKAAAILSPPPPVSLFPQSLSLFPSLRQLSRTCTTQRVPCVVLPIAAFPAKLPRPSSHKLCGLAPTAFGALTPL
ncbi:uncharacterized protein M421DRAFT_136643 [Didymella exigua CBS 183.55]|uniref:Uncharacterized protein n=1 Tax=Didymella exigua CBS 183.55 TaxID=1150837 RepID=A0A6A5RLM4_9PLEO|nr:uncharacterized protein M421DRAFT_136643 [Didymella exigua CBS 183.55]KAF1929331.1 hypothetical protein M421DRAFT_136643 [Didymella exigua CBS 183.55]